MVRCDSARIVAEESGLIAALTADHLLCIFSAALLSIAPRSAHAQSRPATLIFLVSLPSCSALTLASLVAWSRRLQATYLLRRTRGEWHEGVIVFPSGDVVLRFHRLFGHVDRTIEAASLSRVEIERGCAPHVCGFRSYLRLHYIATDGRAQVLSVCQSELVDDLHQVQQYIETLKDRAMAF